MNATTPTARCSEHGLERSTARPHFRWGDARCPRCRTLARKGAYKARCSVRSRPRLARAVRSAAERGPDRPLRDGECIGATSTLRWNRSRWFTSRRDRKRERACSRPRRNAARDGRRGARRHSRSAAQVGPFHCLYCRGINARIGKKTLSSKARGDREERWFSFLGFDAFMRRMEEAVRLSSEAAAPTVVAPALSAGYGQSAYPKDVLLRVVEDRAQDLMTRAAAADALSGIDLAERARVRTVAATTASADLREQLEVLAESEDASGDLTPPHRLRAIRAER